MYNHDTDVLFPSRIIPELSDLRGEDWNLLVQQVHECEPTDPARIAFTLMMVRINNCTTCQADSYRALKGCTQCAQLNIQRFPGNDQELVALFEQAQKEISDYLSARPHPL
jgi:hypothetical protein